MSRHIAYHNYILDLGSSVEQARAEFKSHLVAAGWRIIEDSPVVNGTGYFTFMPPASEGVGNNIGEDVCRLTITGTTLTLRGGVRVKQEQKQITQIKLLASNTNRVRLTVDGRGINVPGEYSSDPVVWAGRLAAAFQADAGVSGRFQVSAEGGVVTLTGKTSLDSATFVDLGYSTILHVQPALVENTVILSPVASRSVTIDLASGFAYYLSIFARTITLASETVSGYYGPVSATWADHDAALRGCPAGCCPVELFVATTGGGSTLVLVTAGTEALNAVHGYGHLANMNSAVSRLVAPAQNYAIPPEAMTRPTNLLFTANLSSAQVMVGFGPSWERSAPLGVGSLATADLMGSSSYYGNLDYSVVVPGYALPDLTVPMSKAPAQLKLGLVALQDRLLSLAAPITDADTTLTLTDGANLPTAGEVLVGKETISYSGRNGNTLTGLTRGRFGTAAAAAAAGAQVLQGGWYLRFNDNMIFCGYVKPGAVV